MNKRLLQAYMDRQGDSQLRLAKAMSTSLSRFSAKINGYRGAAFGLDEVIFIKKRYRLTPEEVDRIFLTEEARGNADGL